MNKATPRRVRGTDPWRRPASRVRPYVLAMATAMSTTTALAAAVAR